MSKRVWPDDYCDMIPARDLKAGDVVVLDRKNKKTVELASVKTKWMHPGLSVVLDAAGREFIVSQDGLLPREHTKAPGVTRITEMEAIA